MNKGFIKISDSIYKDDWKLISDLFHDFRPFHIEFRPWENDVWYFHGESELFDEMKPGESAPQYDVLFTRHEDGTYTYKFERVKNYYNSLMKPGS